MFRVVSAKAVRYALVPMLSFWIAGTACLLGCSVQAAQSQTNAPSDDHAVVTAHESCASSKSHDCCAGKQASTQDTSETKSVAEIALTPQGGTSGTMGECPLGIRATAVISKVGQEQTTIVLPLPSVPSVAPAVPEHTSPVIDPLRVPNRGHTYLRCCVFLI